MDTYLDFERFCLASARELVHGRAHRTRACEKDRETDQSDTVDGASPFAIPFIARQFLVRLGWLLFHGWQGIGALAAQRLIVIGRHGRSRPTDREDRFLFRLLQCY